tara:strand:+ start:100 stop:216 length:117 start_codon:yes stop_codon:yes gene_type:complete
MEMDKVNEYLQIAIKKAFNANEIKVAYSEGIEIGNIGE